MPPPLPLKLRQQRLIEVTARRVDALAEWRNQNGKAIGLVWVLAGWAFAQLAFDVAVIWVWVKG